MKTYIIVVDWPHREDRMFLVYANTEQEAEAMAEKKLIELGDAEPNEISDPSSEIDLIAMEAEGATAPEQPELIWIV